MQVTKGQVVYSNPQSLVASATYQKVILANSFADALDPINYPGSLNLLIANVGGLNPAQFLLTFGNQNASGLTGFPLGATASNPVIIPDLHPNTILWLRSSAGTTLTFQVGKVSA